MPRCRSEVDLSYFRPTSFEEPSSAVDVADYRKLRKHGPLEMVNVMCALVVLGCSEQHQTQSTPDIHTWQYLLRVPQTDLVVFRKGIVIPRAL